TLHSGPPPNGRMGATGNYNGYYISVFVLATSVLQIYLVQIGSIYLPLAFIALYAAAAYLIFETRQTADRLIFLFVALFCLEAVSIIWSPDRLNGMRDVVFGLPFLFCFLLGKTLHLKSPRSAVDVLKLYCFIGMFQSCLVILFRLFPL